MHLGSQAVSERLDTRGEVIHFDSADLTGLLSKLGQSTE